MTFRSYVPGVTLRKVYSPLSLVVTLISKPVALLVAHCSQAGRGWRTLYVVFCQTITESCSTQAQLVTTLRSQPAATFRWPRSAICVSRLKLEFLNFTVEEY